MKAFDIEMGKASKEFDGLKRLSALNKGAEEVAKFITALGSESNPRFFKDVEGGKRVAKFFLHHLLKEKFGGKNVETEAIDSTVEAASKGKKKPLRQLVHKALKSSHPGKFVRLLKRIGFMQ